MSEHHELRVTPADGGLLFECDVDGCGRHLVIDRVSGAMTVIDRGDPAALHRGRIGDVALEAPVVADR